MRLKISAADPARVSVDALALPFIPESERSAGPLPLEGHLSPEVKSWVVTRTDAITWCETRDMRAGRVMLISEGVRETVEELTGGFCGSATPEVLALERWHARLSLGARIERAAVGAELSSLGIYVGEDLELAAALVHGARMRAYRFFDGGERSGLETLHLLVDRSVLREAKRRVTAAWTAAEVTCVGRSLADLPPNEGTPQGIVGRVRKVFRGTGVAVEALGPARLRSEGLKLIEAVDRGSRNPARLLRLEYNAERAGKVPTVVWLGKGVTLDAGGYDLKQHAIHEMSYDKAGATAVIGAVLGAAREGLDLHIVGLCAFVENLVGQEALQPGEILEAHDGTRVYIENTDAEGRLLLADLLSWSAALEPDLTVDLATLTGAANTALGEPYAALFSNDDRVRELMLTCGDRSDDRLWPMPVHEFHDRELAHPHADLKNVGVSAGAASAAAAFLRYFVSGPWAHVDMGGKASFPYERDYTGAGATGYGTRLLLELARELAERGGLDA